MIIDASVGSKWILEGEEYQEISRQFFTRHIEGKEIIIVPDLFFYEVANTCTTKAGLPIRKIINSLKVLEKANLVIYHPDYDDILQSVKSAKKYRTTVYDMLYAQVAKKKNTILVTADEKFVAKTKFPFVKLLSEYSS